MQRGNRELHEVPKNAGRKLCDIISINTQIMPHQYNL